MENHIGIGADEQHIYIRKQKAWKLKAGGIEPQPEFGGFSAIAGQTISPTIICTGGFVPASPFELDPLTIQLMHLGEIFVPANVRVTGLRVWFGTTVGSSGEAGSVAIYDSTGVRLAASANHVIEDITGGDAYGSVPFSAPVDIKGPGTYYIGIMSADLGNFGVMMHPAGAFRAWASDTTAAGVVTEGGDNDRPPLKLASITSGFTANKAPVASLY